jgi:hypothetical protein
MFLISGVIIPTLLAVRFGTVLSRVQASVQTFGTVPQSESVGVGDVLNSKTKVFENKFSIKLDAQFEYQEDQCTVNGFVHLSWLDNFFSLRISSPCQRRTQNTPTPQVV